jgi:hypothetical protein
MDWRFFKGIVFRKKKKKKNNAEAQLEQGELAQII